MKTLKLILDDDSEDELTIGLIRLSKKCPDHELFFQMNRLNPFQFKRIDDFEVKGAYYDYFFSRFEAYSRDRKTCIRIIKNKSSESRQKNAVTELFADEHETRCLLTEHEDVDYIISTSDTIHDFSLILLPEKWAFTVQEISLSSSDELYHLIQYYE